MRIARAGGVVRVRRVGFAFLLGTAGVVPLAALAQTASGATAIAPSTTPVTSVNLADYGLVARYPLASKENPMGGDTSCTSGSGDVLADEASAVAYDPTGNGGSGSLFVLGDGGACVVQTTVAGTYIDSMTLASGNSAQGTAFYDTEGITYAGQDGGKPQLVITEERYRQLDEFDYTAGTTMTLANAQAVKLGTTIGNIGLEGVTYDPATSNGANCSNQTVGTVTGNFCQGFVVVKEKQPEDIFQTNVDWGSRGTQSTDPATGTATNGGPGANEGTGDAPTALFPPADAHLNDFSDVFALSNIASLDGTDAITANGQSYDGDLLIDSQESGSIELVNRSGGIKSRLDLWPNPSSGLDVVDETHEGVAMDQYGNLYVDSEDGAGPNAPELEVYAPTTNADKSPTAVTLATTKGTLPSTTTTANGPVKLSALSVTDSDGIGTDTYTVTATDGSHNDVSNLFSADHTGLYVASGASLAAATSPVIITVTVKDAAAVDASTFPNGVTSSPFTLTITPHTPVTGSESNIIISEVDPSGSGSGNNSYGEDWFELTNTGTQPVELTGWSADDSHEVAGKFPLLGVSTIAPGESVVFVQANTATGATTTPADTVAAFRSDWGLSSSVQVGWYSDEDGLSQSGDEVNVYDAGENLVTGVSFGASENKVSFDNSAGITGPIDTFSDPGGDDGSYTDSTGETGSPGFAHIAPTVAITEVDPTGSSMSYAADWFELTNYGAQPINLSGWTMDDSSDALATSVSMTVGTASPILAPGQSIVFAEDPADSSVSSGSEPVATLNTDLAGLESAFEHAWFTGGAAPSGFLFGTYGGKGVGLSTGGDGVNLFDASGNHVTGVTFGAASSTSPIATVDNTAGGSTVSTLSQVGVNGAFLSASGAEVGSPGTATAVTPPPPPPSVAITEVDPTGSSMSYAADWFEVTNTGTTAANLTGWKIDDSSDAFSSAVPLAGVSSIPAGKSAVFFEDTNGTDATIEAAFSQAWFGTATLPSGFLIGHYGGSGVGLSTGGDAVNLFDASGNHVTGVTFGAASATAPIATFDNTAGSSTVSTLSQVGIHGAFLSANGAEVGSPAGASPTPPPPPPVVVSEVAPWGSGSTPYAADWFELTNTGTTPVNLTGWTMDDNSNAFANSVALHGVATLPAGKSAVFMEDTGGLVDATLESEFSQAWFGSATPPTGFSMGFYGGSGVGLSSSGDAVNIFDSAGDRVTGVAFGASPSTAPFATFDNTAGIGSTTLPLPTISTLSAIGVNGAYVSADDQEIGSPFPIVDTTAPTIVAKPSPAPNANGWNNAAVTVSFVCTDGGTGVDGAASSLGPVVLTASGTATGTCVDRAGNSATTSYSAKIDTVAPTVTFSGNAGTYGILSTVAITSAATDALSGIASTSGVGATGPAWSFGAGSHTLVAKATDEAGNVGTATTTFTVTVKPADLSTLTTQFVTGSARYKAANPLSKLVVGLLVSAASNLLLDFAPSSSPTVKAHLVATYRQGLQSLVSLDWLTVSQETILGGLAGSI